MMTSNSLIPIQCQACGATGEVLRVTANLQCRCGSTDLDLFDKEASQQSHHTWITNGQWGDKDEDDEEEDDGQVHLHPEEQEHYDAGYAHGKQGVAPRYLKGAHGAGAYLLGHAHGQRDAGYDQRRQGAAHGPGTGWGSSRPDPTSNWSDYAGPTPGYNENITRKEDADDSHVCPVCNGTGHDQRASGGGYDETTCRNCHGTGKVVYPTENDTPSLDAHVPSRPQLGGGAHGHYSSKAAPGKSYKDINGGGGGGARVAVPGLKSNKLVTANQSDKIVAMAATIVENNSGLTTQEAFELARRAVVSFPEDGDE